MKPRTEEFLNLLLWSAEMLAQPTFRNLTESFEGWSYRNGLMRQVRALEKRRMVESEACVSEHRLYRLTKRGRVHVLGGRDPETRWARDWDGCWRLALFDVPVEENAQRERLRRYLRRRGFGCLQKSVWITPDSLEEEQQTLEGGAIRVQSLILMEARPCAHESDKEIVSGAWNFDRINSRYTHFLSVLDNRPREPLRSEAASRALLRWASAERKAWLAAVTADPLLPSCLHPAGYRGPEAWRRRVGVCGQVRRLFETYRV